MSETTVTLERIAEIRAFDLTCLRTPTTPCRSREDHPDYSPLAVSEWCEHCVIAYMGLALDAASAERDNLRNEMLRTKEAKRKPE